VADARRRKVSVAMATYNGERHIRAQLDSLAAQTRPPDELVVCDDGSTDSTLAIVETFAAEGHFRVRVERNPSNLGPTRNFEKAISLAIGDLIFLCDQDDVWFPEKIAIVVAAFDSAHDVQVFTNDVIPTSVDLEPSPLTMAENLASIGKPAENITLGCATALRRDWARRIYPSPGSSTVRPTFDGWANDISGFLGVRRFLVRPLQYYRRHGGNVSSATMHEPRAITLGAMIHESPFAAPIETWSNHVALLAVYREWLDGNRSTLTAFALDKAITAIDRQRDAYLGRIALSRQTFPARLAGIWHLLTTGGYKHFHGWKSALRDLTRSPGASQSASA
jgi:glycosyltransferase involved in cell wall biosynthesis